MTMKMRKMGWVLRGRERRMPTQSRYLSSVAEQNLERTFSRRCARHPPASWRCSGDFGQHGPKNVRGPCSRPASCLNVIFRHHTQACITVISPARGCDCSDYNARGTPFCASKKSGTIFTGWRRYLLHPVKLYNDFFGAQMEVPLAL